MQLSHQSSSNIVFVVFQKFIQMFLYDRHQKCLNYNQMQLCLYGQKKSLGTGLPSLLVQTDLIWRISGRTW